MSQNGKGSKPRPLAVPYDKYSDNYDSIFRKKKATHKKIKNPKYSAGLSKDNFDGVRYN